jgi:hypothetical protein
MVWSRKGGETHLSMAQHKRILDTKGSDEARARGQRYKLAGQPSQSTKKSGRKFVLPGVTA